MTLFVSDDPRWWPLIDSYRIVSYLVVAAFGGVMYDWALTFGQEVELVWRQRWSIMTVLYLGVRYLGILFATLDMLGSAPTILLTYTECWTMYVVWRWASVLVFAMLWAIITTRLHAMYQRSRKVLTFLIVTFLAVNIFAVVAAIMTSMYTSGEELILSGTHQCFIGYEEYVLLLDCISWVLATVWEVLTLCLAVWIAVKHFCELRRHSAGGIIGDCFTVLIKTHMLYFASSAAVSCFQLMLDLSPTLSAGYTQDFQIYAGFLQLVKVVQIFMLGPRLILDVRDYHAKLVYDSDAAPGMTSIAFQECMHISTGSIV